MELSDHRGPKPHDARLQCAWCKTRGYPDGRSGLGWSLSYRKSYLAAITGGNAADVEAATGRRELGEGRAEVGPGLPTRCRRRLFPVVSGEHWRIGGMRMAPLRQQRWP